MLPTQAFGVEVVEVGYPHHATSTLFRRGKQEDTRFPAATKASATELLDHLLPEAEVNLDVGSAGRPPPPPIKERSKYPCNHCCSASRVKFEGATRGPSKRSKLVGDTVFASRGGNDPAPPDRRVHREKFLRPSRCETRGPPVLLSASSPLPARLQWLDSKVLPSEPFRDIRSGRIATSTQKGRCLLAQLPQQPLQRAR